MDSPPLQPDRLISPQPATAVSPTVVIDDSRGRFSFDFLSDHAVIGHLTELRNRLLIAIVVTALTTTFGFFLASPVLRFLMSLAPKGIQFVQLTTGEAFMATFKVSIVMGIALALPVWLFNTIRFVFPGLHSHEKNWAIVILLLGLCLFILGCAFAVILVAPVTIGWLVQFGQDLAVNQIGLANYLDFVGVITLLTGVSFELPMLILGLVWARVLSRAQLIAQWRPAIVGIFLAAAIITPSQDPFSMTLVGLAMCVLFLFSLWLTRFIPIKNS